MMHNYFGNHGMKLIRSARDAFWRSLFSRKQLRACKAALCRCQGRQDGVEDYLLGCVIIVRRASRSTSSSAPSS